MYIMGIRIIVSHKFCIIQRCKFRNVYITALGIAVEMCSGTEKGRCTLERKARPHSGQALAAMGERP